MDPAVQRGSPTHEFGVLLNGVIRTRALGGDYTMPSLVCQFRGVHLVRRPGEAGQSRQNVSEG